VIGVPYWLVLVSGNGERRNKTIPVDEGWKEKKKNSRGRFDGISYRTYCSSYGSVMHGANLEIRNELQ